MFKTKISFIAVFGAMCLGVWAQLPVIPFSPAPNPCGFGIQDDMQTYSASASLSGLNGGNACGWNGAYATTTFEDLPQIYHQDDMQNYSAAAGVTGLASGINWFSAYTAYTYEDFAITNYQDAVTELTAGNDLTLGTFAGGTNDFPTPGITNAISRQAWTNNYAAKGF